MAFEGNENDFYELWRSVFVLQIDVICAWERAFGGYKDGFWAYLFQVINVLDDVIGIYKQYVVETQKKSLWMMNIVPLINKQYVVETPKKSLWMMNIVFLN